MIAESLRGIELKSWTVRWFRRFSYISNVCAYNSHRILRDLMRSAVCASSHWPSVAFMCGLWAGHFRFSYPFKHELAVFGACLEPLSYCKTRLRIPNWSRCGDTTTLSEIFHEVIFYRKCCHLLRGTDARQATRCTNHHKFLLPL